MKQARNAIRFIILLLAGVIFLSFDLSDVKYSGRWVDILNSKFYDAPFFITLNIHENIGFENSVYPTTIISAGDRWSTLTGQFLRFNVQNIGLSGKVLNDEPDKFNQTNVIGFDNSTNSEFFDPVIHKNILALTRTYFVEDCSKWFSPSIFGVDILLNHNKKSTIARLDFTQCFNSNVQLWDFESIILHELGHAAGIRHHPTATENDLMRKGLANGKCYGLSGLDLFAIRRLYGGQDIDTLSSIPCVSFDTSPFDGLIQEQNPGTVIDPADPCAGKSCCSTCRKISGGVTNISDIAMERMSIFASNEIHFNVNILRRLFVENQDELINMAISPLPEFKQVQTALNDFKAINAPLLDAAFRCEQNTQAKIQGSASASGKDLTLKEENLEPFKKLINEVRSHTKSKELKKELNKLQKSIDDMKGKTIQEAAIMYDRVGGF